MGVADGRRDGKECVGRPAPSGANGTPGRYRGTFFMPERGDEVLVAFVHAGHRNRGYSMQGSPIASTLQYIADVQITPDEK